MANKVEKIVTNKVLELLAQDEVPFWQKPWKSVNPKNYLSDRPYHGANVVFLNMYAMMYNWEQMLFIPEGKIFGTKNSPPEKYKGKPRFELKFGSDHNAVMVTYSVTPESKRNSDRKKGVPEEEIENRKYWYSLKYYRVYNVGELTLHNPEDVAKLEELKNNPTLPVSYDDWKAGLPEKPTIHYGGDVACYIPSMNKIAIPPVTQFESVEDFCATEAHEIMHWTGPILGRKVSNGFGSEEYAFEELIAQLGSAYVSSHCGHLL